MGFWAERKYQIDRWVDTYSSSYIHIWCLQFVPWPVSLNGRRKHSLGCGDGDDDGGDTAVICWAPPRGAFMVPWNVHALAPYSSSPPCETGTTVPTGQIREQVASCTPGWPDCAVPISIPLLCSIQELWLEHAGIQDSTLKAAPCPWCMKGLETANRDGVIGPRQSRPRNP